MRNPPRIGKRTCDPPSHHVLIHLIIIRNDSITPYTVSTETSIGQRMKLTLIDTPGIDFTTPGTPTSNLNAELWSMKLVDEVESRLQASLMLVRARFRLDRSKC